MNSSGSSVRISDFGRDDCFWPVGSLHCCGLGFCSDCVGFAEKGCRNGGFWIVHFSTERDIVGWRRSWVHLMHARAVRNRHCYCRRWLWWLTSSVSWLVGTYWEWRSWVCVFYVCAVYVCAMVFWNRGEWGSGIDRYNVFRRYRDRYTCFWLWLIRTGYGNIALWLLVFSWMWSSCGEWKSG